MKRLYIGIVGASLLAAGAPAGAAVLYDSEGFETPTYTAGAMNGQDSWSTSVEFTIVNNAPNAHAGSQYGNVASAAGSTGAARNFTESTGTVVDFDGWFYLASGNHWADVQLRDGAGSFPTFAAFGFLNGQPDLPGFSTDFVYRDQVGPGGGGVGTGNYIRLAEYTPDTWHRVQATLDISAGTYDLYLDGALVGNDLLRRQPTADSVGRITINREAEVTPAVIRFDDIVIGDPIPEPSIGMAGIAMLGLLGRRCRRA